MKLWILLFFYGSICFSQTLLQENVEKFIGVDIFENYYYLKEGSFFKSNLNNDYKNINYGTPDTVDISNPLQILLHYKFFNKLVLIDNQLNFITEYNLPIGTHLLASAGKDKIWIYDNIQMLLSIYTLTTQKTEITSIPNQTDIEQLKGNLNEALALNTQQELITYNYLARKTGIKKSTDTQYPISLHKPYVIKNTSLWDKDKIVLQNLANIQAFEVVDYNLYILRENQIYRISIPKN